MFDIVGQNLTLSLAKDVVVGSGLALSGDVLGVEQIGSGWVFAAGDRFEHNFSNSTAASTNGRLVLDIMGFAERNGGSVPEPATLALAGPGMTLVGRRRAQV